MNLVNYYKDLLSDKKTFYYTGFKFKSEYLKNTTKFLDDFFRYAGKAPLAEFNCYMPDDNERFFRNKHMVSAYLLGCLIADKIFGIDTIKVKQPEMDADFNYIWYLICLFHDAGYGLERNMQERDILRTAFDNSEGAIARPLSKTYLVMSKFKRRQGIHSSIWYGHNKFFLNFKRKRKTQNEPILECKIDEEDIISNYYRRHKYIIFSSGFKYKYPTYKSKLINDYFAFRLSDRQAGCIDHGIAGGYVFFDTMIRNYIYCYKEANKNERCLFEKFLYNGKSYCLEQFSIFGYVADCIIAHNIWNGRGNESAYHRFGLDCLIGDSYNRINKNKNPFLFLLALSDTLEPLKIFRNSIWSEEEILRQISFTFEDEILRISSINNEIYDAYRRKLKNIEDWLDLKLIFNEEKSEIKLIFKTI